MLSPKLLHDYQKQMIFHSLYQNNSMIWGFLGSGKTICTLSAIVHRMKVGQVKKSLVIAPLRVATSVWGKEAKKWQHTRHLNFSLIHGSNKTKKRALFSDADVYLINYEGLPWLTKELTHYFINPGKPLPFQLVVYDEISKMKNSQSVRFRGGNKEVTDSKGKSIIVKTLGFKKIIPHIEYSIGLTGTPASNGYLNLFGQYYALDGGVRLGHYVTHYKDAYFESDYNGWTYTPTKSGKIQIQNKIADITLSMEDGSKYLDLPKVTYKDMWVNLPSKALTHYQKIEKDFFTQLESGVDIEIFNAAALSNKLLQVSNGNAYHGEDGSWEKIHDAKLEALDEVMEEAAGSPVLVAYNYKSDAYRIMEYFKKYKPVNLTAEKSTKTEAILDKWNKGNIKMIICHPAGAGHGIDSLQNSGHIVVWFGLNWDLELYIQMNGRIDRQGQKKPVSIVRILSNDTMDIVVKDRIEQKTQDQKQLKKAISKYRQSLKG